MGSYLSAQNAAINQNVLSLGNSAGWQTLLCGVKALLGGETWLCRMRLGLGHSLRWLWVFPLSASSSRNSTASEDFLFTFGRVQKDLAQNRFYFLEFHVYPGIPWDQDSKVFFSMDTCNQRFRGTESYNSEILFWDNDGTIWPLYQPSSCGRWTKLVPFQFPGHSWILTLALCCSCSSVTKSCLTLCNPMDCSTSASLSYAIFRSLITLMSIELVMAILPSHPLPLLLCPQSFPASGSFPISWLLAKVLELQL